MGKLVTYMVLEIYFDIDLRCKSTADVQNGHNFRVHVCFKGELVVKF